MIPISYPSPRVSQVDAHILDSELLSLLKEQLSSIFQLHSNSKWSYNQNPELWTLLLNIIIFKETIWKTGSSYGLALQNLKLTDFKSGKIIGRSKKSILFFLIVATYFFNKLQSYFYSLDNDTPQDTSEPTNVVSRGVWKVRKYLFAHKGAILSSADHTLKVANLINFSLFLLNGRYPTVTHRILGISMTPIVTDLLKFNGNNVNFEFQNRQLVWNVMTEFLVFTLPLLQLGKLRRMTNKIIKRKSKKGENSADHENNSRYKHLPLSQCAICHDINFQAAATGNKTFPSAGSVTNPYITNCGHVYCYVCIATRFNAMKTMGDEMPCLRCHKKLEWFKEYDDVVEDAIIFEGEEEDEILYEEENMNDEEHDEKDYNEKEHEDDQNLDEVDENNLDSESESSDSEEYDYDDYDDYEDETQ